VAEHTCILCRIYRPDADPRFADTVCQADLLRLERDLLAIPGLFRRVADGDTVEAYGRWYESVDDGGNATGQLRRCDPVAGLLPAGTIRARTHQPSVTGSREAPLPINVDAVDLTAAPRAGAATGDPRDQVGYLSVATVLDGWARYVRNSIVPNFSLPRRDVTHLVRFLHNQLYAMVDELPGALPGLAGDLRGLCAALRHILGDTDPPPQPLLGVRCRHCQTMSTLVPWPDGRYVECRACGQLYNPGDRVALAKEQVADLQRPRHVIVDGQLPVLQP
jgi:hypothetical protein